MCVVVDGVGASGVELSNHSDCFASVNVSTHEIKDIRGNDGNDLFCLSDSQKNDQIHGNISEPPFAIVASCVSCMPGVPCCCVPLSR